MAENTREIVLDTLLALEKEQDFSHNLIKAVLDKYDYLDKKDKAFFKRVTEGTLERRLELDYYLNHFSKVPVNRMKPLIRCLLRMSVYQLLYMDAVPDSAVCNEACKLAGKRHFQNLKGFVNGVLRSVAKNKENLPMPDAKEAPVEFLSVKYSMPTWIVEMWLEEYGYEVTAKLLNGLLKIHPVSLRFDTGLSAEEREKLCEGMRAQGAVLTRSEYLPYVYLLENAEGLKNLPGYEDGKFLVQDVSSALTVEAAGIRSTDFVVDVCAAPGGKTILASEKAAKVLSRDVSEEKTALILENLQRMGRTNVETEVFDGSVCDEALREKADVVLLDVPCSGLGILGKKRDIKYRVTGEGLKSLQELQKQIVRASASYVKPGGTLMYSTCTIHRAENEEMVKFITGELGFRPVSLQGILPENLLACKAEIAEKRQAAGKTVVQENIGTDGLTQEEADACIQLLPGFMDADGFFMARFVKR